jgi:hypothetical protein
MHGKTPGKILLIILTGFMQFEKAINNVSGSIKWRKMKRLLPFGMFIVPYVKVKHDNFI